MGAIYIGIYNEIKDAIKDAQAEGDIVFYDVDYDYYFRVSQTTEAGDVLAYHLVTKWDGLHPAYYTWKQIKEVGNE